MNQNVVTYLTQNKNSYPKEVLVEELKKAGYSDQDIIESAGYVYENSDGNQGRPISQIVNFWDFKIKIAYNNPSQKLKDFLFGFFAPFVGILLAWIPLIGLALFIFEIFSIIYLFNRRRFISFGLISNFILGLFLIFMFVLIIFVFDGMHLF